MPTADFVIQATQDLSLAVASQKTAAFADDIQYAVMGYKKRARVFELSEKDGVLFKPETQLRVNFLRQELQKFLHPLQTPSPSAGALEDLGAAKFALVTTSSELSLLGFSIAIGSFPYFHSRLSEGIEELESHKFENLDSYALAFLIDCVLTQHTPEQLEANDAALLKGLFNFIKKVATGDSAFNAKFLAEKMLRELNIKFKDLSKANATFFMSELAHGRRDYDRDMAEFNLQLIRTAILNAETRIMERKPAHQFDRIYNMINTFFVANGIMLGDKNGKLDVPYHINSSDEDEEVNILWAILDILVSKDWKNYLNKKDSIFDLLSKLKSALEQLKNEVDGPEGLKRAANSAYKALAAIDLFDDRSAMPSLGEVQDLFLRTFYPELKDYADFDIEKHPVKANGQETVAALLRHHLPLHGVAFVAQMQAKRWLEAQSTPKASAETKAHSDVDLSPETIKAFAALFKMDEATLRSAIEKLLAPLLEELEGKLKQTGARAVMHRVEIRVQAPSSEEGLLTRGHASSGGAGGVAPHLLALAPQGRAAAAGGHLALMAGATGGAGAVAPHLLALVPQGRAAAAGTGGLALADRADGALVGAAGTTLALSSAADPSSALSVQSASKGGGWFERGFGFFKRENPLAVTAQRTGSGVTLMVVLGNGQAILQGPVPELRDADTAIAIRATTAGAGAAGVRAGAAAPRLEDAASQALVPALKR